MTVTDMEEIELTDERVWIFKETEAAGYTTPTRKAKSLVNQKQDVEWDDLIAKEVGSSYGSPSRIAVIEVDEDEN